MSTGNQTKINRLLTLHLPGTVLQSGWLVDRGYSLELQRNYRNSNWLRSLGSGAMVRMGDAVGYEGAIYALQSQSGLSIHPAGRTALSLQGKTHYLELAAQKVTVFGSKGERLPAWFAKHDWGVALDYHASSFLPPNLGMVSIALSNFSINVSAPARAIMECLYLAPEHQPLVECAELMDGLNNLRPDQAQALLEQCRSVKVKRLFLYLAEKAGHSWFKYLKPDSIDLGSGKRSLAKQGVYIPAYQITVPKELEAHGKHSL